MGVHSRNFSEWPLFSQMGLEIHIRGLFIVVSVLSCLCMAPSLLIIISVSLLDLKFYYVGGGYGLKDSWKIPVALWSSVADGYGYRQLVSYAAGGISHGHLLEFICLFGLLVQFYSD
ncbi:hypothetical protein Tco_0861086 [Tanacetum coccineum]|uniref:Uncharacterized protein n=1 Tax=Tanacetum coccineum TaxID=301880 RepID=A0ABQ5BIH3_9ASTR